MVRFRSVRSSLLRRPTLGHALLVIFTCVSIASIARWMLGAAADPVPFVTYYPAIVVCTLLAGWRAGLTSTFLSMAVVNLVFMQPKMVITADWRTITMMGLFVLSCGMLVAIAQTLRATVASLQAATDRTEYLNQELLHRVRNSLTVVNSLAAMTYRSDPANFVAAFSKRMTALAEGLDVLSRHEGQECDLHETLARALAPFAQEDRIVLTGPTCLLPPQACVPLVLAIHELCTNAVKYGALSTQVGCIRIETQLDRQHGEARLSWQELGGPVVSTPQRAGLGTALLADPVLGPASLIYDPQGLRCELRLRCVC